MSTDVDKVFEELRHSLPSQGPLEFFVHHNTFHCLEGLNFKEALRYGKNVYKGRVLKSESEYRKDFSLGKIDSKIFLNYIDKFLNKNKLTEEFQKDFCKDLLIYNKRDCGNFLHDEVIKTCVANEEIEEVFYSEHLKEAYGIDLDEAISPVIFKFIAAYFDQGMAHWKMPLREEGILKCFNENFKTCSVFSSKWERNLSENLKDFGDVSSDKLIPLLLKKNKIEDVNVVKYLFDLGYRYKGWAGLILSLEKHPEWNKVESIKPDFEEFITVILLCEYSYLSSLGSEFDVFQKKLPFRRMKSVYSEDFILRASDLFQDKYENMNKELLLEVIKQLPDFEREFLWQEAFEETYYIGFLSSFEKAQLEPAQQEKGKTDLQVLCCIDDREEPFRRYIEETGSNIETFGVAGHFGLDIKYKGVFNAHHRSLCPDIIKPSKKVSEKIIEGTAGRQVYRMWGFFLRSNNIGSKTLFRGVFFQFVTGLTSLVSMSLSVISPKLLNKFRSYLGGIFNKNIKTVLEYQQSGSDGISLNERVAYGRNLLKTIGLLEDFAPVIMVLGHGSHSLNNPHEAAHDCGACGGGRGAPNARLISEILNSVDVRKELTKEGLLIPDETVFVGGFHNTCSNEVIFFDVPKSESVQKGIEIVQEASKKDALERCRKYEDVPLGISAEKAYSHCMGRAHNYMQPRPEYGHATNALCFVGPREMSRKLFLDRRAFLTSYNPELDTSKSDILKNILSAIGPVCSGINLEYYFSYMDNEVYGCGTKLSHNVTSLVGVMNGYQSDLLLGLPWQMVEIHDPYRLMLLVSCSKSAMEEIISTLPSLNRLVLNKWIHLSVYDPLDKKIYRYLESGFEESTFSSVPQVKYSKKDLVSFKKREACSLGIIGS